VRGPLGARGSRLRAARRARLEGSAARDAALAAATPPALPSKGSSEPPAGDRRRARRALGDGCRDRHGADGASRRHAREPLAGASRLGGSRAPRPPRYLPRGAPLVGARAPTLAEADLRARLGARGALHTGRAIGPLLCRLERRTAPHLSKAPREPRVRA